MHRKKNHNLVPCNLVLGVGQVALYSWFKPAPLTLNLFTFGVMHAIVFQIAINALYPRASWKESCEQLHVNEKDFLSVVLMLMKVWGNPWLSW